MKNVSCQSTSTLVLLMSLLIVQRRHPHRFQNRNRFEIVFVFLIAIFKSLFEIGKSWSILFQLLTSASSIVVEELQSQPRVNKANAVSIVCDTLLPNLLHPVPLISKDYKEMVSDNGEFSVVRKRGNNDYVQGTRKSGVGSLRATTSKIYIYAGDFHLEATPYDLKEFLKTSFPQKEFDIQALPKYRFQNNCKQLCLFNINKWRCLARRG